VRVEQFYVTRAHLERIHTRWSVADTSGRIVAYCALKDDASRLAGALNESVLRCQMVADMERNRANGVTPLTINEQAPRETG
jgi:hypothetical protein